MEKRRLWRQGRFFGENLEETDKNAKYNLEETDKNAKYNFEERYKFAKMNLEETPSSCYNKDIFGR